MISRWLKAIQLPPVDIFSLFVPNASAFNERAPKLINRLRGLAAAKLGGSHIVMQGVTWNHLLSADRTAGTKLSKSQFYFPCTARLKKKIPTIITKIKRSDKSENILKLSGRKQAKPFVRGISVCVRVCAVSLHECRIMQFSHVHTRVWRWRSSFSLCIHFGVQTVCF